MFVFEAVRDGVELQDLVGARGWLAFGDAEKEVVFEILDQLRAISFLSHKDH